jgi:uncharacterized protein YggE
MVINGMIRKRHCVRSVGLVCLALSLLNGGEGRLAGDESKRTISVSAIGSASIKPDMAEIRAVVSGTAAIGGDALKRFRSNRGRAFGAVKQLKFKELKIDGGGPAIVSGNAANGQQNGVVVAAGVVIPQQDSAAPNVCEVVLIQLPSIDRLPDQQAIDAVIKIVDSLKDAGISVLGVQFKSTRFANAKSSALRAAMDAARKKPESRASLSSAMVGPVVSIRETSGPGSANANASEMISQQLAQAFQATAGGALSPGEEGPTSMTLSPIVVTAVLDVEFELQRGK